MSLFSIRDVQSAIYIQKLVLPDIVLFCKCAPQDFT